MSYTALRFDTSQALADFWSDALLDRGALSADLSDPFVETENESPLYGEPDPSGISANPNIELWAQSRVTALFPADLRLDDIAALLAEIADENELSVPLYETYPVAERDWVRETQAQFAAIPIADNFQIVPTWLEPPKDVPHILRLDPGLAFGTGSHPTTRLCLQWLAKNPPKNQTVLDYGCGSGILLLAARLLGADEHGSYGTDIDPQAIIASRENAQLNHISAQFGLPDTVPEARQFDLVIANILANPLILLAPLLAARTKNGGQIILSGILKDQKNDIIARYGEWFDMDAGEEQDGWVLITGTRKG
jgi:ribosomal protein L11 methyltransferase